MIMAATSMLGAMVLILMIKGVEIIKPHPHCSALVRLISNILVIIKVIKAIIMTTLIKLLLRCVVPCCYCY